MAVHEGAETTLDDFELGGSCEGHEPVLHARDRLVGCSRCGRTVPVTVVAEYTLREALAELAEAPCRNNRIPAAAGGDHTLRVHPRGDQGEQVVCEICGRSAPLQGDGSRALHSLAEIPCAEGWTHRELLDAIVGPTPATPPLSALGIDSWRGVEPSGQGADTVRLLRHGGFQYTLYVARTDDGAVEEPESDGEPSYEVTLRTGPSTSHEAVETVSLPEADPADQTVQTRAERLVTFLAATDELGAGAFASLVDHHTSSDEAHRDSWLDDAYSAARETFSEQVGGSPEAFTETFTEGGDTREVLRRVVGGTGFEDVDEADFARTQVGERPHFPSLFEYVADQYGWRPPIANYERNSG
jgi:hypothetical protein